MFASVPASWHTRWFSHCYTYWKKFCCWTRSRRHCPSEIESLGSQNSAAHSSTFKPSVTSPCLLSGSRRPGGEDLAGGTAAGGSAKVMASRGGATRPNGPNAGNKICQFKLVLLGESAVGKSSLVLRFVKGQFHEFQESTIGGEGGAGISCFMCRQAVREPVAFAAPLADFAFHCKHTSLLECVTIRAAIYD